MDSETEGVDLENEVLENEVLTPERKLYRLRNHPTINYNNGRSNWRSVGRNNLLVGYHDLQSVAKAYVNDVNYISTFVETTPPTNIVTNETILNQYIIKQGIKVLVKNARLQYKKSCSSSMTVELLIRRSLKTSDMNNEERVWHT